MKKLILMLLSAVFMVFAYSACKNDDAAEFYMEFLDTGKSDCIIIRQDGLSMLCDCADKDDGGYITERLNELNISALDYLIITHFDKDHIGSAAFIIESFDVRNVIMPSYGEDSDEYFEMMSAISMSDAKTVVLTDDTAFESKNGKITVNAPRKEYDDDNNNSLIVSIEYENKNILLTGDAKKDRLNEFLSENSTIYDIIKLPHHGDYNKKLAELLMRSEPEFCVITCDAGKSTVEEKTVNAAGKYAKELLYTSDGRISFTYKNGEIIKNQSPLLYICK